MAKNLTTTASSSTKPVRKSRAKPAPVATSMVVAHAETIEADDFSQLLADLGAAPDAADVVIESAADPVLELVLVPETPIVAVSDDILEAAMASVEATEAAAAGAAPESAVIDGAVPTDGAIAEDTPVIAGADADPAAPAKVRTPRVHYSDKVERLQARVGEKLGEYSVLTTEDAMVDDAELAAVMARTLDTIRAMNKKEQNRASNFIEFLAGKKAKLNNVLERVLKVLERDGFVTTGNKGNVIKDLVARPYSIASARAMGGNTIGMFTDLKVIVADGKGKFIANPDSLLLAKAKSLLSAAAAAPLAAAAAGAEPEGEDDEAVEPAATPAAALSTDPLAELEAALM